MDIYRRQVKSGHCSDVLLKRAISTIRIEVTEGRVWSAGREICAGPICHPDRLWRTGCPCGIVLPTLTLKMEGEIMLLQSKAFLMKILFEHPKYVFALVELIIYELGGKKAFRACL